MTIVIKNSSQIEGIRKSCQLASRAIEYITQFVRPGVSTDYLDDLCKNYIQGYGGIPAPLGYKGFPKSICTSINEDICHGIPSEHVLQDGDIISIDISTILDGYYGDTCTTLPVGNVSKEALKLMQITKECLDIGVSMVKPNRHIGEIGSAIYKHAKANQYSVVENFVGHGVGLALHEEPAVPHVAKKKDGPIMKPGMIFTIEPMINIGKAAAVIRENGWTAKTEDNSLSAQFEHTVLVTNTGVEVLTKLS